MQVPDFGRVKEELPNACGSGPGISDINEPPSNALSYLSLPETIGFDADGNVSNPHVS